MLAQIAPIDTAVGPEALRAIGIVLAAALAAAAILGRTSAGARVGDARRRSR